VGSRELLFLWEGKKKDTTIQFLRKRELLVHSAREPSVSMKGKNILVAFRHQRNNRLHAMLGKIESSVVQWAEYEFLYFSLGNWPSISLN